MAAGRRTTMRDVARLAGVSQATVSFVVNKASHQSISAETREKVHQAVAELGYTPSATGRALRAGRSNVVLVIIPDWAIPPSVLQLAVRELTRSLSASGLVVLAFQKWGADDEMDVLWRGVAPAAVVLLEDVDDAVERQLASAGVSHATTIVTVAEGTEQKLGVDMARISRLQAEHLVARGHVRIGYASTTDPRARTFDDLRRDGASEVCRNQGLTPLTTVSVELDTQAAARAVSELREHGVTAVCCYDDDTAVAVLSGCRELGLRVPDDLAIVGADDTPVAQLTVPTLTSVHYDFAGFAEFIAAGVARGLGLATHQPDPPAGGMEVRHRAST